MVRDLVVVVAEEVRLDLVVVDIVDYFAGPVLRSYQQEAIVAPELVVISQRQLGLAHSLLLQVPLAFEAVIGLQAGLAQADLDHNSFVAEAEAPLVVVLPPFALSLVSQILPRQETWIAAPVVGSFMRSLLMEL